MVSSRFYFLHASATALSSASYVMATHSMFSATETLGGTAAVLTYSFISKDVIGQLGSLVVLRYSSLADTSPKKCIVASAFLECMATFGELATPLVPQHFTLLAGTSNVLHNIAFSGFGAITSKIVAHMAPAHVLGQTFARVGATTTLASSVGMWIGLGLVPYLGAVPFFVLGISVARYMLTMALARNIV